MAVTNVSICNLALGKAKHSRQITALDGTDTSREATECIRFFEMERNAVLEDSPWKFAEKNLILTKDDREKDIVKSGTFKWTLSGNGTNEFYLEADAGGTPSLTKPNNVYEDADGDNTAMTEGTLGSLNAGEWAFGDSSEELGYDTIYVRLSDSVDPDTKSDGYLEAAYVMLGWDYTYKFPSDCLKPRIVHEQNDRSNPYDFDVSLSNVPGTASTDIKVLLSDLNEAHLIYTAEITDPTLYSYQFIDALSWKLAALLANILRGDKEHSKTCMEMYAILIKQSMALDAHEQRTTPENSTSYANARR